MGRSLMTWKTLGGIQVIPLDLQWRFYTYLSHVQKTRPDTFHWNAGCLIGIFISWFIVIPTSLGKCLSRIYPRQPRFLCIAHVKDPWKSCKNCQLLRQKINVKDIWQILSTSCNIQKVRKSTKTWQNLAGTQDGRSFFVGQHWLGQVHSSKYTEEKGVPSPCLVYLVPFHNLNATVCWMGIFESIQPLPLPAKNTAELQYRR